MKQLPAATIIETAPSYTIVVSDLPDGRSAIIGWHTDFQAAVDHAWSFLYTFNGLPDEDAADWRSHNIQMMYLTPNKSDNKGGPTERLNVETGRAYIQYPTVPIYMNQTAWDYLTKLRDQYGYRGKASWQGTTKFLLALLKANPDPRIDWTDARPYDMKKMDSVQDEHGQFRIWSFAYVDDDIANMGTRRKMQRHVNAVDFDQIIKLAIPIANRYLIGPFRGKALSDRARAGATLDAIGMKYLLYRNEPQMSPLPTKPRRRRLNPAGIAF